MIIDHPVASGCTSANSRMYSNEVPAHVATSSKKPGQIRVGRASVPHHVAGGHPVSWVSSVSSYDVSPSLSIVIRFGLTENN